MPISQIKNVSFSSPYDAEAQEIERSRRLAESLRQQGMTPMGGTEMAGGWAIKKSPLEGIAKMLNAYSGAQREAEATSKTRELSDRYRQDLINTLKRGQEAMSGRPAQSFPAVDDPAAGQYAPASTSPAVAPDVERASAAYLEHPATAGLGIQMAGQQAQDLRRQQMLAEILRTGGGASGTPGTPGMAGNTQGAAPNSASGSSGNTLGLNPTALALMLSGDQTLSGVGKAVQEANKPLAAREGAPVINPATGQIMFYAPKLEAGMNPTFEGGRVTGVQNIPGYVPSMSDRTRATEGARAEFDLVTVPTPGGGSQQMTRAQAAQMLGGGQQLPPGVPPEDGPAYNHVLNEARQGRKATAYGPMPQTQGAGAMGFTRPESVRAGESRFSEKVGSEFGELYANLIKADMNAPASIAKYDRLGTLLGNVSTGKFKGTTTQIKAAAKSLGFDLDTLGIGDDLAPAQAAQALSNQLALELRNPAGGAGMPGALSDKDREFLVQSIPGLENDPAAIPLMIEYRKKLEQRTQQVAKQAREYKRRTGFVDDGFYDELARWSDSNPLFPAQPAPRAAPVAASDEDLRFTALKYGISVEEVKRRLGAR